jgi:hypothetical protein
MMMNTVMLNEMSFVCQCGAGALARVLVMLVFDLPRWLQASP